MTDDEPRRFPPPPDDFSADQGAIWIEAVRRIPGTVNAAKLEILEAYCIERARWKDAEKDLRENGHLLMLRNDKGEVTKIIGSPQLTIARQAQRLALSLAKQLKLKG